jgi:hypothetical protein
MLSSSSLHWQLLTTTFICCLVDLWLHSYSDCLVSVQCYPISCCAMSWNDMLCIELMSWQYSVMQCYAMLCIMFLHVFVSLWCMSMSIFI